MTRAARSIYVFGIVLIIVGGVFIGAPNTILALLQQPPTSEPWIHVLGVPVMAIGVFHVTSARANLVPFFRVSVRVRFFVLASFTAMAVLQIVPAVVIGFGLVDVAFGTWTHLALREGEATA